MYPRVEININGIKENIVKLKNVCKKNNIELNVVTKMLSNNKEIVKSIIDTGIKIISDSRIENLKNYSCFNVEKWLIREVMQCEVEDVIKYSDASFNCELSTIKLLNEEAIKQSKIHKVILTYELGDLREGVDYQGLKSLALKCKELSNIRIYGIASNLSCYGGVIPTKENMTELCDVANKLESECDLKLDVVSGCNSTSIKMLYNNEIPNRINSVRFGESIYLGNIPSYEEKISDLNHDNFILKAQIIEIQNKNSIPNGEIFKDSFGQIPVFEEKGIRRRALIGIGKQDTGLSLEPLDKDIKIIGGSSDYLIVDITDSNIDYKVGDILSFIPNYESALRLMTSNYVLKDLKEK